jgi:hypothetical protein
MSSITTDTRKEEGNTIRKHIMPSMLTMFILFLIAGIIIIARGHLVADAKESIPGISTDQIVLDETVYNETETDILIQLFNVMELTIDQLEQSDDQCAIYFNGLKEYLSSADLSCKEKEVLQINQLLDDLKDVLQLEPKKDFDKMSLDGRKIAGFISEQIYRICDLKLAFNMQGQIEKIEDKNGYELYSLQTTSVQEVQIDIFVITVLIILLLLCLCIIIAKKNQLFIKEVIFDGINEKGFA